MRVDPVRSRVARRSLLAIAALALAFATGRAWAFQPHMQNALGALQNAQGELQAAEPNKGGHRERALGLVAQAISQVEMGIQFAE